MTVSARSPDQHMSGMLYRCFEGRGHWFETGRARQIAAIVAADRYPCGGKRSNMGSS